MIRVYSANFTKEDYEKLSEIFLHGLHTLAPSLTQCEKQRNCLTCEHHRVCSAIIKAVDYCDKQAEQMVEP